MTPEDFLRLNIDKYSWKALTEQYNAFFGTAYTVSGILKKCQSNDIKKSFAGDRRCKLHISKETKQQIVKFIAPILDKYRWTELAVLVSDKFNVSCPIPSLRELAKNNNLHKSTKSNAEHKLRYPKEFRAFCIAHLSEYTLAQLQTIAKEQFHFSIAIPNLTKYVSAIRVKYNIPEKVVNSRTYTAQEVAFLKSIHQQYSDTEISNLFQQKFGRPLPPCSLSYLRRSVLKESKNGKHYEKSISTLHEPGQLMFRSGEFFVKLPKGRISARRYYYEKYHNEKLASKDKVILLDGNPNNLSEANLLKVTTAECAKVAGLGFCKKGKLTEAAIEVIRAEEAIKKIATAR